MGKTLTIQIDDIPPSYNHYLGKNKRFTYAKDKKHWEMLVRLAATGLIPKEPYHEFTVRLHYIVPDRRRRDLDNLAGKFLFDPLVKLGVIEDDNMFCMKDLSLSGEVIKNIKRTIITIEEYE